MADDWYVSVGQQRLQEINAMRSQAMADLEQAKAYDNESASDAIQRIANCDAERANLSALYSQYVQAMNPPRPPEPSKEERAARPWDRMDWQDVVDLARQSKYAKDIRPDDPGLVAGWNEARRRRARGE
jgi:hypothetical protein